jgi:hypothetical protein
MKNLIAVISCHKNAIAAQAIRQTWAKDSTTEVKFFYGIGNHANRTSDEIFLPAPDTYVGLVEKVKAVIAWAYVNTYDFMLKCDDDAYVVPSRVRFSSDHSGWWAPKGYIHGGAGYVLSRRSMGILQCAPITSISEDWWVTDVLNRSAIESEDWGTHIYKRRTIGDPFPRVPSRNNDIAVSAEFAPQEMLKVHKEFLNEERLAEDRMSADEYKQYLKGKQS